MGNNLQELYRKQDGTTNAQQVEEREQAICHSGFSFFMGRFFPNAPRGKMALTSSNMFFLASPETLCSWHGYGEYSS